MNKSFQIPYTQKRPISGTSSSCMQICILQNWCVQTLMLNRPTGYIFAYNYTQNRPISGTSICQHISCMQICILQNLYVCVCVYVHVCVCVSKKTHTNTSEIFKRPKETYILPKQAYVHIKKKNGTSVQYAIMSVCTYIYIFVGVYVCVCQKRTKCIQQRLKHTQRRLIKQTCVRPKETYIKKCSGHLCGM